MSAFLSKAQDFTISGYVKDASTGEDLLFANVSVLKEGKGVTANLYGFYSLTLPAAQYEVSYSFLGYQTKIIKIDLDRDKSINIELQSDATQLEEIIVTARKEDENITNTEISVVSLDVKEVSKIPVIFGEQNILKTFQLMPGVASNSEGGSGFFVRGGDTDQNLILLDEAPVYNASHLLGFFSVFNSDALKDVKLFKGGIPAQYGGRASSVMDIRMSEGNLKEWGAKGGIGLISSRLTVEGPVIKDKASVIISGRRTYADVMGKLFSDNFDDLSLYFYDFNAKANYRISDSDRIFFSGYLGRDKFGLDAFGFDWGNKTFTTRWNHTFSNKLFSNTSLIYSDYSYGFDIDAGGVGIKLKSGIYDYNLKQDYTYYFNSENKISYGWQGILHDFQPTVFSFDGESNNNDISRSAVEGALFISNEQKIGKRLSMNYGLRLSTFSNVGSFTEEVLNEEKAVIGQETFDEGDFYNNFINLEPRINATFLMNSETSFKASYNRNFQYLHLLSNSTSGSPTDMWIPSTKEVKPTRGDQVALGIFRNFSNNTIKFSTEVYYKWLENTVDYKDGAETFGVPNIETQLEFGKGKAYGAEFLLEKTKGKFTGWMSYTLSRSFLKSDKINNGSWYSARQDRIHDISLVGIYELTPKLSLSASWVYYTGDAVTFPSGKYYIDGDLVNLYTERNADRMPDYHRLDVGLTWNIRESRRFSNNLNFSVYNAYNRKNAYSITFDENEMGQTQATRLALFGAIPAITWNFEF